jgi:site-specific DNA-cytosine methylase
METTKHRPKIVTEKVLEVELGVSRTTLWRLRQQGLPSRRVGRSLRFDLHEVEKWISTQKFDGTSVSPESLEARNQKEGDASQMSLFQSEEWKERALSLSQADLPPCHWSQATAFDPKHRPQSPNRPSSTVRREWWRFPQEAHLLDEVGEKYRRLKAWEIAVLQGFPADWGVNAGLGELDLIKGYGNAVPPPLASVLFETLVEMIPELPKLSLEICAGFGGLALGASRAGLEHLGMFDFWNPAVQVLKSSGGWGSDLAHCADVSKVDWTQFAGKVGVLSGGPPCQPWSAGGQGRGEEDDRDLLGLMPRVISDLRPAVFILENVPGLLTGVNEPYAKRLIERLRSPSNGLSYGCAAGILNAADFGVPQVRRRVFIVGFRDADACFAHAFLDAVYRRRTHADPRKIIPPGLEPWLTFADALPEWECQPIGWRKWFSMHQLEKDIQLRSAQIEIAPFGRGGPILGLNWPNRGNEFGWQDGCWQVASSTENREREEHRPILLKDDSCGDPTRDPWFVTGDPSHSLDALNLSHRRLANLVYLDAPRLQTDDSSFASEDQYARLDTWLTVLHGLLRRSIGLLADDGAIIVLCGTVESPYVELQLNELLGPLNRVGTIAWQKSYSPRNMTGMTELTATHDNLVIFAKRREGSLPPVCLQVPSKAPNDDGDPRGPWKAEHKGANKPDVSYETHVPPYDWRIVGGELPKGFWRLCEKSGVLWADSSAVSKCGEWIVEIEVSDQESNSARQKYRIRVTEDAPIVEAIAPTWLVVDRDSSGRVTNEPKGGGDIQLVTKSLPVARLGSEYSALLVAKGGKPFTGRVRPGADTSTPIDITVQSPETVRQIARKYKVNPKDVFLANGGELDVDGILPVGTTLRLVKYSRYWEYTSETLAKSCATYDLQFGAKKRSSIPAIKRHLQAYEPLNQMSVWTTESGGKRDDAKRIGWTEDAKKELQAMRDSGLISEVPNPVISKPSGLVGRLVALFSRENGVVIDVGSPAAEMASIACALNRNVVYVELPSDERRRETITMPRLRSAARGLHPLPVGALFEGNSNSQAGESGYKCGSAPRPAYDDAAPCVFEVGSVALRIKRDPRIAEIDYKAYHSETVRFLHMLASLEGLVPTMSLGDSPIFAVSYNLGIAATYVPSSVTLTIGRIVALLQTVQSKCQGRSAKLRVYYHRGVDPKNTEIPEGVELRRVPYDLNLVGQKISR